MKNRFNTKQIPPIPEFIPADKHALFRQCWRGFYQFWRWQLSEDQRYWYACRHTVGREETEKQLGPDDDFTLLLLQQNFD